METRTIDTHFLEDVLLGLTSNPKFLYSKYFYDEKGSKLFQDIMNLEEYYLTNCEYEIFEQQKEKILEIFTQSNPKFDLVEFGAGDGLKTKVLLEYFLGKDADFRYLPVDISRDALDGLENSLKVAWPELQVECMENDYFRALDELKENNTNPKVVLFLGSNIGNFPQEKEIQFLKDLHSHLNKGDLLLIGFDLRKHPEVIEAAYNDAKGVTREFNFNLLRRINDELGGDFDLDQFMHFPTYDPKNGEMKSFLISKQNQEVHIQALGQKIHFEEWEAVHTETSKKFLLSEVESMAKKTGFEVVQHLFDTKRYFVDSIWRA